jgi:predicted amidophosphoribosyltransferase
MDMNQLLGTDLKFDINKCEKCGLKFKTYTNQEVCDLCNEPINLRGTRIRVLIIDEPPEQNL